ncbi:hypothetical protein Tco_1362524 [Tanacetum coccineum]
MVLSTKRLEFYSVFKVGIQDIKGGCHLGKSGQDRFGVAVLGWVMGVLVWFIWLGQFVGVGCGGGFGVCSRNYTLDEDTYLTFLHDDGTEMDLLFIHVADPTKVKVGERERTKEEARLLDSTVGRVVPLLPIAPDRADSKLEASMEKLFDESGGANQGDSVVAGGGQEIEAEIVLGVSGFSHPPKKLRSDHGTSSRAASSGKSLTVLKQLLASSILNVESGVEAVATLPFVTSSIFATPEHESGVPTDSITGLNLRTIGASKRFVISSDSSHHSSTNVPRAEGDSLIRSAVVPPMMTEEVITTHVAEDSNPFRWTPSWVPMLLLRFMPLCFMILSHQERYDRTSRVLPIFPGKSFPWGLGRLIMRVFMRFLFCTGTFLTTLVDNLNASREFIDHLAPLVLFRQIHDMDYKELFTEFSVGTARQDKEIENLKAQLLFKEAEAAEKNMALEDEKKSLSGKVAKLQSMISVKDRELKDVDATVTSLKCVCWRPHVLASVNERVEKLDADLAEMACHLEEKFYPHLLTTIFGQRWLLTHGLKLVLVKCLNSSEYLTALEAAISRSIEKGIQDGLAAGIDHGRTGRSLADIVAYNPPVQVDFNSALQELCEVDFRLLADLKSHKDASIEDVMNLLRLESPLADAPGMDSLQPDIEQLKVPIHRANITEKRTSISVPGSHCLQRPYPTTLASASSFPPISFKTIRIICVRSRLISKDSSFLIMSTSAVLMVGMPISTGITASVLMSRNYTLDEDTYPTFLHDDEMEMDLLAFIHVADPTKVKVGERERTKEEARLLDSTVGRVVPLLPIAPDRVDSELEASMEKLFDESGGANQGDSVAGGGQEIEAEIVLGVRFVDEDNVVAEKPKRPRKKRQAATDVSGFSHPPKKLRSDHGTSSGAASSEAVAASTFVTSSYFCHPVHGGGVPTDSITVQNVPGLEGDSLIRSVVVPPVMTEEVITTHVASIHSATAPESGTKVITPVHASMFHDSESSGTFIDHLAHLVLFRQIRDMDYKELFTEFSVGTARQYFKVEKTWLLRMKWKSLSGKVAELQSMISIKDRELKDVDATVTSLKSQNDGLADQVCALELMCVCWRPHVLASVNERVGKLDADLAEIACHLEEKFYPHLLTTIFGRRWLLTHGLKLVLVKCLNSSEYLTTLGAAISRSIEKGIQDGLAAGIDHGRTGRSLADIVAYNPPVQVDFNSALQELCEVDFRLLANLKSHKDASIEDVMNLLRLESPLADAPSMDSLQHDIEQLKVPIHSTSISVPGATGTTTALSTTFASASSIPPISVKDY